ncbi:hypothetical protein SGPA1_11343 [Streptomyces misionensis JCM 4497]
MRQVTAHLPMRAPRTRHGTLRPAQESRWTRTRVEERSQCSAGVAWRTSPRTGGAASSPSVPTTVSTAATS